VTWTVRSVIAMALWVAAGLLTLFFVFSGWWIIAPFAFAVGGGGQILILILAILVLGTVAHLIGRVLGNENAPNLTVFPRLAHNADPEGG
jgi:VIT1/CCC1 family predicted Fe2+/Mn2+ transporter